MLGMNLGTLVAHLNMDATQFNRMMGKAEAKIKRTAQRMGAIGKKMTVALTVPLVAFATKSVFAFAKFDDAMTQSTAIMANMSESMRKEMEMTAKTISSRSITSATDLAKSYYYLASAGLTAEQSIGALGIVERFSVAGMFDMATATDLLTDAQSALGLTVKDNEQNMINMTRVSDVLVGANTLANASVEQFSKALTTRAATALKTLNKDIEEGVAVLAAYADQGIKAEQAGEKLHIVLRDLQTAVRKNADVWEAQGMAVYDSAEKMFSMGELIAQLEKKFMGMTDKQKASTAAMLGFKDRSFAAMQTLIGSSEKIRGFEADLRKMGGTTKMVSNKQLKSFSAQMKILWNNVTNATMKIGEELAPTIRDLGGYILKATTWWNGLSDATRSQIVQIGLWVAALGPGLMILSKLLMTFRSLVIVMKVMSVTMIGTPWGAAAIAVGALALVIWKLSAASTQAAQDQEALNRALAGTTSAQEQYEDATWRIARAQELGDLQKVSTYYNQQRDAVNELVLEFTKLQKASETGKIEWEGYGLEAGGKPGILEKAAEMGITPLMTYEQVYQGEILMKYQVKINDLLETAKRRYKELATTAETANEKAVKSANEHEESIKKILDKLGQVPEKMKAVDESGNKWDFLKKALSGLGKLDDKIIPDPKKTFKMFNEEMMRWEAHGKAIGDVFANSLGDIIFNMGKIIDGTYNWKKALGNVTQSLSKLILKYALLEPLARAIAYSITGIKPGGMLWGTPPAAKALGAVVSGGNITPFASGGVVSSPTLFGLQNSRYGLMGESGPEAIMPLKRGEDGKLGIEGGQGDVYVTMNIQTPNADSFKKSERQMIGDLKRRLR
jgi:TP901 family phage tail tape measure protein